MTLFFLLGLLLSAAFLSSIPVFRSSFDEKF
jgi:hypothetical protein